MGASGREEAKGDDADAVRTPVGVRSGVDNDGVEESVSKMLAQPAQVRGVSLVDGGGELDLNGQDPPVVAYHDEVDLVVEIGRAHV